MSKPSLAELNAMTDAAVAELLAPLFEHAAWVTQDVAPLRPFVSLTAMHAAFMTRLRATPEAGIVAFLRGHPALSPSTLRRGITAESMLEQRSAGIQDLDEAATVRLDAANATYERRFGFPFILAVRGASYATVIAALERRCASSDAAELEEAVSEIGAISWMRLLACVTPAPTGGISLHVLDTTRAKPAAGLHGELFASSGSSVAVFVTDGNGRAPTMLGGGLLTAGGYEWRLDTAAYFARHGRATPDRSFLPVVSVRFAVANPEEHFHVPVLLTPGSYTTYRGS